MRGGIIDISNQAKSTVKKSSSGIDSIKQKGFVLFVCNFNMCRSASAERFLIRELAQKEPRFLEKIEVISAGIINEEIRQLFERRVIPVPEFGRSPNEQLIEIGLRKGIDLSKHKSKLLNSSMAEAAHLIVTMEGNQKRTVMSLYPQTKGRVFTFREFVGASNLPAITIIENSVTLPQYEPETGRYYYPYEFDNQTVESTKQCVKRGIERFLSYLQED